jgi:hypothetical protein
VHMGQIIGRGRAQHQAPRVKLHTRK